MQTNRAVMDRMLADRAARNRRTAYWNNLADEVRTRRLMMERAAANDDTGTPARTGS